MYPLQSSLFILSYLLPFSSVRIYSNTFVLSNRLQLSANIPSVHLYFSIVVDARFLSLTASNVLLMACCVLVSSIFLASCGNSLFLVVKPAEQKA